MRWAVILIVCGVAETLDAPRLPSFTRKGSGNLPAHLALAKDDTSPVGLRRSPSLTRLGRKREAQ